MTREDVILLVRAAATGVTQAFRRRYDELSQRVLALETRTDDTHAKRLNALEFSIVQTVGRLNAVEAQPRGLIYKGVWSSSEKYEAGDVATLGGSMWHANRATMERPGGTSAWTLCVKSGRDAR